MKNFIKQTCSLIVVLLLNSFVSYAQDWADPQGAIHNQLMSLIQARYGMDYQYIGYSVLDTLLLYSNRDNENIQDPYGTLRGCVLFSAYKDNGESEPNTFIAGFVKNGQIIWDNAPGSRADLSGDLLYAQDINNDGEVDLLFSEIDRELLLSGRPSFLCYLYVLSWNGTSGRFINACRNDGKSTMIGDGDFELVDKNGDNVQEIRSALPDIDMDWADYRTSTYPYITYRWNGSQYGFWGSVGQIAGNEFLPANRLRVAVKCNLEKTANIFHYNYVIGNDTLSKQIVSDIYISGLRDTTTNLAPPLWQSGSSSFIGGRAFIKYSGGTYYLIHPGQTMGGFETISSVLPCIVKYYIQGYTLPVFGSAEEEKQNIYNNSVKGYTLGTSDTTLSFIPLNFLDTLTSYTTQSLALGWIKDTATANKYLGYFASAKTNLQQSNTDSSRTILQKVLQDVSVDSTSAITNEAYALIRYNTEYLLDHLEISSIQMNLSTGWNLVSIPFLQSDYSPPVVFPGHAGSIFGYNSVAKSYAAALTLACGTGYWTNYLNAPNVTINGSTTGPLTVNTSAAGWILVGSRSTPVNTSSLQLSNGAAIAGSVFRYNIATKMYQVTTVINPGEAVWMNVTKPCTITIP